MGVKIRELCPIAPPHNSIPTSTLPLTFFDLMWYAFPHPIERVFLYSVPAITTTSFLDSHLPNLKHSLSLALKLFYPLASHLVHGTHDQAPSLRYSPRDSVTLTVAESDDNLRELSSDKPKQASSFHSLVPSLPSSKPNQPVAALQVTLFPDQGIGIGISMLHPLMDGSASNHFMRTWASICKSGDDTNITEEPPLLNRNIIPDPMGLQEAFTIEASKSSIHFGSLDVRSRSDVLRSTFRLTAARLDGLRKWVQRKTSNGSRRSSFTLAVALVWTCLLKARRLPPKEMEQLVFAVDCRTRLDPPIPTSYYGNCVSLLFVEVSGNRLVSEDGFLMAVEAIGEGIKGLDGGGAFVGMESIVRKIAEVVTMEPLSIAGSPRLGVYKVDFGWGRPIKSEVVSIEGGGAMSLAENGEEDGGGGLEIGLAIPLIAMEDFVVLFEEDLQKCM